MRVGLSTPAGGIAPRARPRVPVLATVAIVYIALVAPAQVAALNPLGSTVAFVAVAAAGLVAMLVTPRSRWFLRSCLAVLTGFGVAVTANAGRTLLVWLAMALILAAWTGVGRRPVPIAPAAAPASAVPVAVASYAAVRLGSQIGANWQPLVALAVGAGTAFVWSLLLPAGAADRLRSFGHGLDRFLTDLPAVVGGVILWCAARLGSVLGRREPEPGWASRPTVGIDNRSPRSAALPGRRLRPWTVPLVGAALVALVGWFGVRSLVGAGPVAATGTTAAPVGADDGAGDGGDIRVRSAAAVGVLPPTGPVPAAYRGDAWFRSFRRDMAWVMDERVAWRPMRVHRVLDVTTPTVNVRDRVRSSWTAPPCSCRRATVWLYGGSGAFGVGQRDGHTIASELARAAAEDGIVVDVWNRGVPGQMHWRNSTRLAWDLTQSPPPDLVVFYEGAEEVASELELRSRGLGNTLAPVESFITDLYDEVGGVPLVPPSAPDGVSLQGWPTVDSAERSPGQLAAERYDRSRAMSRWITEAAGLPVRYYWQPSRFDAGSDTTPAPDRAAAHRRAAAALPGDVRDLSGTLDGAPRPVFYDDTNHNELGAELVAAAIWQDLRSELMSLAEEPS